MWGPFLIPDDFRSFMRQVVRYLDEPTEEPKFLDAEDALQDETGYGGRVDGGEYRFTYISSNGHHKWHVQVAEAAIRDIADGLLIEVMGERIDIVRTTSREPKGHPLLIWGEYGDDALVVRDRGELLHTLDALHQLARTAPRLLRVWTATEDQIVAMLWRGDCALYVIESLDGYATSCGDSGRTDSFEVVDHDGRPSTVPYHDCVPWSVARNALLRFIERGELGPEVRTEGRIPTGLLMMGDANRAEALAARSEVPRTLAVTSIPRMLAPPPVDPGPAPHPTPRPAPRQEATIDEPMFDSIDGGEPAARESADTITLAADALLLGAAPLVAGTALPAEDVAAWARRLLDVLYARELIELGRVSLDEVTYQLGGLLQAHGAEAQHSLDTAEWLANEISAVRGIQKMFATPGDLQLALRRSRLG